MWNRLITSWVYGGVLAGLLLIILALPITRDWSPVLTATYLLLPVYMIHQYEEHDNDRFRLFMNKTLAQGREVLTPTAVFIINVPGVWGVMSVSLWLALYSRAGFALISAYLVIVNAIVHVVGALVFRGYNPGLMTAIALFIPSGTYALWKVQTSGAGAVPMHICGLLTAVAIHAVIVVDFRRRRTLLEKGSAPRLT